MDLANFSATIPAVAATLTALAPAIIWAARRMTRLSRTLTALESAVDLHDAQNRGVVLVLTAPEHPRSAMPLLRQAGWTVCPVSMTRHDKALTPDTDRFRADLPVADVVLVQGYTAEEAAALAADRTFRDALGPGAAVVLFTPDARTRYDQALWGDGDQSVTTPATAEAAVRSAVARRRHIQALQGVRPGGLAAARAELLAR